MSTRLFTHKNFHIENDGIHLLRNGFDYKTLLKTDLVEVHITRGPQVKNWMVLLSMGLGLIAFASYYIIRLIDFLINTDDIIYIEQFVVPIIPLALGIVCLNNGLRRGEVLICTLKTGKVLRIPLLNKFEKAELEKVLRSQFKYK
ncbi:hypothetical protein [Roseivirga thermotolerans]|jgi:hypothetical protein|uniref:hypothetical protein n=1 Tax=Roseivirga thermotolerans TaxID=1758176 RepID=UPI00273FD612|nr:hypothetical protein [Roseivirga thermotolerans]